ncbi:unnamed protein product [Rotaria sordida]|uniref:RanBP2-type domain-containing protein n=1 Tax=Rotaria sordida TaxID=392033 RepID=A0A819A2N8_9BILA|nr:unnamed protein product [Rotaria sordida]CAF3778002.1 unnamed protein product [Rotaria sordida]
MGNNQSGIRTWNMDDLAFGTSPNAITMDDLLIAVHNIRAKYFGGDAIENDPSMHQMQNDLLSIDQTLKRFFFRKKNNQQSSEDVPSEEYYYEDQQSILPTETNDSIYNQHYLEPNLLDNNILPSSISIIDLPNDQVNSTNKNFWKCGNCTAENKITENVCRRCNLAETQL